MRILIVEDGQSRGALAAARALGAAGHEVGLGGPLRGCASYSRWCHRYHKITDARRSIDAFVAGISKAVSKEHYETILPAGDPELLALSLHRDRLGCHFPYPSHDVVVTAMDKKRLCDVATSAGLSVPSTHSFDDYRWEELEPPYIVKPRLRFGRTIDAITSLDVRITMERDGVRRRAAELEAAGAEALVQERREGALLAYACVRHPERGIIARSLQIASHVWPAGRGVSTRAETIPIEEHLAEQIDGLLARLGWEGIAQLQFIRDRSGDHLVDLNGRLYGSLALAINAGANLPVAWMDPDGSTGADAATGVRYQWLEGDMKRALKQSSGRTRAVLSALGYMRGSHGPVASLNDPKPMFGEMMRVMRDRFGRGDA